MIYAPPPKVDNPRVKINGLTNNAATLLSLDESLLSKHMMLIGGTGCGPEVSKAYSMNGTVGLALAHSPKDQKESLKQFVSFCWYYPDNDLCRRGNSYIYLNKHPVNRRNNNFDIVNNISDRLRGALETLLSANGDAVAGFPLTSYQYKYNAQSKANCAISPHWI